MKSPTTKPKAAKQVFSAEELEALQDTRRERRKGGKADGEADLRAALAKLAPDEQAMGERLHEIVMASAPGLAPKTWYGMPAWADADGKALCFFKPAGKFKERYATFGFNTNAALDDGNMWVTSFALVKLAAPEEKTLAALIRKAAGG